MKYLPIAFVAMLAVACGGSDTKTDTPEAPAAPEAEAPVEEAPMEEAPAEAPTDAPAEAPAEEAPAPE